MLKVESWRVYYADGSTFDSSMGTWAEAPPFGIIAVVYYHVDDYKTLDVQAVDDSVYHYLGNGDYEGVKMGLWCDSEGFYRIIDLAERSSSP